MWGYYALFIMMIVVVSILKLVFKVFIVVEYLAKIVLPILTIFLFKKLIIWYIIKFFLANSSRKRLALRNKKLYLVLNHFNFFFDCFLMTFVCFTRIVFSALAALFYMPRLDYSIYGRHLERKDMGFISFVSFVHMEVNQTHPVKLVFCELMLKALKEKNHDDGNKLRVRCRNKWKVLYTLIKNPNLKKQRKLHLAKYKSKIETLVYFLKRHFGSDKKENQKQIIDNLFKKSNDSEKFLQNVEEISKNELNVSNV